MKTENWQTKTLGEIGSIFSGNSINEKEKDSYRDLSASGLYYVATKDISSDAKIDYENGILIPDGKLGKFKIAHKNSVLICAEGGSAGKKLAFNSEHDICFVNKLFAFEAGAEVLPKYVFYYYQSQDFEDDFKSNLSGLIGGISLQKFKNIEIPLPPLNCQLSIINSIETFFSHIDKIAAQAQAAADLYEPYRVKLLQMAFDGKLTAQWRKENGVSDGSWEKKTVSELCEVTSSKRIYQDELVSEGIPFLRVADLICKIQNEERPPELFISNEMYETLCEHDFVPQKNDILVTARGTIGKCYLIGENDTFYFQDGMISWLKDIDSCVLPKYLLILFQSKLITEQIGELQTGSTVKYLSISMLKNFTILVPTLAEQQEIVRILGIVLEKARAVHDETTELLAHIPKLKKAVLAKAFAGAL